MIAEATSVASQTPRALHLPADGLPAGPNTSMRTLPRDPDARTSSQALARIVAANPDGLDVLLQPSPFEPSADFRLPDRPAHGLRLAAVVHDLIPLVFPERYLSDDRVRRRYRAATSALRRYDAILMISEKTMPGSDLAREQRRDCPDSGRQGDVTWPSWEGVSLSDPPASSTTRSLPSS